MSAQQQQIASLTATLRRYVEAFCLNMPNRHVGSPGNRAATDFFAQTLARFGFETHSPNFDCLDWEDDGVTLHAGQETFHALVSPYALSCRLTAPLVAVSTFEEFETADFAGKIVLLHGEIAKEQYIPKHFPFEIPVEHPDMLVRLEQKAPVAILAATTRNPELAGAVYPFPLIEDGDFDIPSAYMTDEEGERLLRHVGEEIALTIESRRILATGCNVIGRKGRNSGAKLVICAHIDAKKGTPGALDNATGVAILLALAELLTDYDGSCGIELVALNGEDYYAASGQAQYLAQNATEFERILLAINLDLVGYREGRTGFSFYGCPEEFTHRIREALSRYDELYEGEAWYQSDHMIFVLNQRPAMAFVSEQFMYLCAEITHTPKDIPNLVDYRKLAETALGLRDIALAIDLK
ncbi:hypothetical protein ANT_03690 [Candidatus Moduliflexus flocculans]|uniref:Carboxypeptidase Q n=1 Tax=Candidatus Moduliflexus flocculans TaxID=1499966 RepID=A0A081BMK6_9BACT|nr:hypothetical protein ANT_03690 [Candidatus Moduliflexus flocculans]